jgi:lipoprotein-releasing system permease protein
LASELQEVLGFPYQVDSWAVTNRALFSALKLEKLAMGLILFLIVVVAAFNIVGTLVMVVVDRTREIGILKSMGMTSRGILRVFMAQGVWIGVIGTSVGTVLGCIISWLLDTYEIIPIPADVYFVDRLPVALHPGDVALIFLASVGVALAATIYPALQASRLEAVEAIRHE